MTARPMPATPFVLAPPRAGTPKLRLRLWHGAALAMLVLLSATLADAASTGPAARAGILAILLKWTPLLFRGFLFNILISVASMTIGTILGGALGITLISLLPPVRLAGSVTMQFFRNAPWLVLLFFAMFLLPFQLRIGPLVIPLPDWLKAVIGLSLPVMANVAEIMRGAVASIPSGQWEAAESLAFKRRQQVWSIIMPQCIKRMLPPWMNLYAILTMSTVLASIVGVNEVMTLAGQVSAAEGGRTDLLTPLYGYIMVWFFLYAYPIALLTTRLERRFAVKM
ncbi:MAG: amino acid ABC transporter permease [Rhodospirillales bacterium]|nr:amino acid ABC transporter permease [Rhodospirillales bacterium]MDE2573844.1 amino acid ABC transporter permease [Rhodospirillales bacterium]